jgi:hypothetical protein
VVRGREAEWWDSRSDQWDYYAEELFSIPRKFFLLSLSRPHVSTSHRYFWRRVDWRWSAAGKGSCNIRENLALLTPARSVYETR